MNYSKEQLRDIFQHRFNREAWKAIVTNIFGAKKVRAANELFTAPEDKEEGYYLGYIDTPDSFRIGLFYYKIKSGSVAHKKVGLRNLVRKFINQNWGEFDAAIVVFDDGREWRLSFVCDIKEEATAPKRFTFVFGEEDNFYRTAIDRFMQLQTQQPTFENIRKAFSVDALSDDFFNTYRDLYADFVQYITGKRYVKEGGKWVERELGRPNYQFKTTFEGDGKLVRDYIKKMFGRIVFLYFLQRKGWLAGNRQYMHDLFYNSNKKDDFLDGVLEPLFFEVLNTDNKYRTVEAKSLPGNENIPYLNGGLFAKDEVDPKTCVFPAEYFRKLFDFLDSYNFTIDENDTDDAEIGIDPEMLGRIFENLLEDNKDKGAFYTPKEIVDYMCRESIIAYLLTDLPERSHELIRRFVETFDASELNDDQRKFIRKKLQAVKICDPAIGSGAFPMGLVNLLSKLYIVMKADTDTAKMKRHIMEQNIYGVDIERGAVDIARLRFWLAMIVEEKEPIPLPNLHFKIMQGNSLLESYNGIDLSDLTKLKDNSSIFEVDSTEREDLISALKAYYKTSDHTKRDRLFNEIIGNVRRQLLNREITLPTGMDPSANTDFFLWHTWFSDVFAQGGFDIVIGNPPYVSIKDLSSEETKRYKIIYSSAKKQTDLYAIFLEKAIRLTRNGGNINFIVPDSINERSNFEPIRSIILKNCSVNSILTLNKVFESATVGSTIICLSKGTSPSFIRLYQTEDKISFAKGEIKSLIISQQKIEKNESKAFLFLSEKETALIQRLMKSGIPLEVYSDFMGRGEEIGRNSELITFNYGKNKIPFVNGTHVTRYNLLNSDLYINKSDVQKDLRKYYSASKILVRQVGTNINATIDNENSVCPQSIYIIRLPNKEETKYVLGLLNSKLFDFIYHKKFNTKKLFPRILLENLKMLPIKVDKAHFSTLINLVDELYNQVRRNSEIEFLIDRLVYQIYGLSYEEVLIVDPHTQISREEYNNIQF